MDGNKTRFAEPESHSDFHHAASKILSLARSLSPQPVSTLSRLCDSRTKRRDYETTTTYHQRDCACSRNRHLQPRERNHHPWKIAKDRRSGRLVDRQRQQQISNPECEKLSE